MWEHFFFLRKEKGPKKKVCLRFLHVLISNFIIYFKLFKLLKPSLATVLLGHNLEDTSSLLDGRARSVNYGPVLSLNVISFKIASCIRAHLVKFELQPG